MASPISSCRKKSHLEDLAKSCPLISPAGIYNLGSNRHYRRLSVGRSSATLWPSRTGTRINPRQQSSSGDLSGYYLIS